MSSHLWYCVILWFPQCKPHWCLWHIHVKDSRCRRPWHDQVPIEFCREADGMRLGGYAVSLNRLSHPALMCLLEGNCLSRCRYPALSAVARSATLGKYWWAGFKSNWEQDVLVWSVLSSQNPAPWREMNQHGLAKGLDRVQPALQQSSGTLSHHLHVCLKHFFDPTTTTSK